MDSKDKDQLVSRLTARFGVDTDFPAPGYTPNGKYSASKLVADGDDARVQTAMRRMVAAGAARFGVRVDQPQSQRISSCDLAPPLARMIDHTALKPQTTEVQIRQLCEEARKYCFASVCVNPSYVPVAASILNGSDVMVCTVLGFPLGASKSEAKALEGELAIKDGADELDMVLNVGYLKSGRYDDVESDIRAVVDRARTVSRNANKSVTVKVILETALLTDEEKVIACVLTRNAGADFVKTSTGFSTGGATASDVALMRRVVGEGFGVKASGGVRSREDAEEMIAHGATRLGASASVEIIKGLVSNSDY